MATEEYRPLWADHVVGTYEREVDKETGLPEPTTVRMKCEKCGATHQHKCTSGAPRQWILRFATVHVKCARDVLKDEFPKQGG